MRESDLYLEPSVRWGAGGDGCVVSVGDGLDDGKAETVAIGTPPGLQRESFERLEEARQFASRDQRTGVGDGKQCASRVGRTKDFDSAARDVVPDRVRDEVVDESLEQHRIAGRDSPV